MTHVDFTEMLNLVESPNIHHVALRPGNFGEIKPKCIIFTPENLKDFHRVECDPTLIFYLYGDDFEIAHYSVEPFGFGVEGDILVLHGKEYEP